MCLQFGGTCHIDLPVAYGFVGRNNRATNEVLFGVFDGTGASIQTWSTPTLRRTIVRKRWRASRLPANRRRFAALTRADRFRVSAAIGASDAAQDSVL